MISEHDRLEILDLAAKYCHTIDGGAFEEWVALFVKEGCLSWEGGEAVGTEQLIQFTVDYKSDPNRGGTPSRHWGMNHTIEGHDQKAKMLSYFLVTIDATSQIAITGTYEDELVKTEEGWRFGRRKIKFNV